MGRSRHVPVQPREPGCPGLIQIGQPPQSMDSARKTKKGLTKIPSRPTSSYGDSEVPPVFDHVSSISPSAPPSFRNISPRGVPAWSPRSTPRSPPRSPRALKDSPRGGRKDSPRGVKEQQQPGTSPRVEPSFGALKSAVREAVRAELEVFFQQPQSSRPIMLPPQSGCGGPAGEDSAANAAAQAALRQSRNSTDTEHLEDQGYDEVTWVDPKQTTNHANHFKKLSTSRKTPDEDDLDARFDSQGSIRLDDTSVAGMLVSQLKALWAMKEPRRTGPLADLVHSLAFERFVQVIILVNCGFMFVSANYDMANLNSPSRIFPWVDLSFQIFYTMELILKLFVHRLYFFWNHDAGFNSFDCFLVMSGFVDIIVSQGNGSGSIALRTVRILKIGKALRAVRVISQFRNLRAILVCIQGSFVTLMWSVLMLCVVFYMFSLIFVQQAAGYLKGQTESGLGVDEETHRLIVDLFGSVQRTMLTLGMAAFGGQDWGDSYNVIERCGSITSLFYLMFIAFTQIALINIITGIFVDSAMQSLAPDKEALALDLQNQEESHAKELEKLCAEVDDNGSGGLTQAQFNRGVAKGHIPMLLHLIGLDRMHVELFFELLCAASPDGVVEIHSFVHGCMRLKGAAKSFDLQMLLVDLKSLQSHQAKEFRDLRRQFQKVELAMGLPTSSPNIGRPPSGQQLAPPSANKAEPQVGRAATERQPGRGH